MNDLLSARKLRRKMLVVIRQQQASDADCLNIIRTAVKIGKRRLVSQLGAWLTSFMRDDD
jgi:hypothetical protein